MDWNSSLVGRITESEELNRTDDFDNEGFGVLPSWVFHLFIPTYYSIVCITGLVGNGMVILILAKYPVMNVVPNIYILNLAAADALFLMGLPFLAYFNSTGRWIFGDTMCRLVLVVDGMNMFTGIFTLTAMSIDRYVAIVHPVWSKQHRTLARARIICLGMWILSGVTTVPFWMYAKTQTYGDVTVCNVICSKTAQQVYIICTFIIGFCFPIIIITILYLQIIAYLINGTRHRQRRVRIGRVGVMVLLAVALFLLCWMPFWIVQMMVVLIEPQNRTKMLKMSYFCTPFLTYANSCLNPAVYTYVRQDFRQFVVKLFRRQPRSWRSSRLESNGKSCNYSASCYTQPHLNTVPAISNATEVTLSLKSSGPNSKLGEGNGKWSENIDGSSDNEVTM
ncbi:somatostatin receptor type 4-like [Ptychodera flava]|uniref:somatostatin receptor type 4-like n=1 Tax=Ptychodera flava TaxID=63121 RepID=UPI00396A38AC